MNILPGITRYVTIGRVKAIRLVWRFDMNTNPPIRKNLRMDNLSIVIQGHQGKAHVKIIPKFALLMRNDNWTGVNFCVEPGAFSRRRRCRTQKCGQLDLSSTRACWLVICQVWLSRVARRQMRAVRVMRLGMRTYRSCMDATDSICRRAAILSPHIANFR